MKTLKQIDCGYRGWFIGNWDNAAYKTDRVEVAYKFYAKGEKGDLHYHKVATEITLVAHGKIIMNGVTFETGDIIIFEPGEVSDCEAIEDSYLLTVKDPAAPNDKYIV